MRTSRARLFSHLTFGAAALAAGLTIIAPAHAFTGDVPGCYQTAPIWNARKGAIVSGISKGPINAVLSAVGESRTHTMLSHGDWATHSTTRSPSPTDIPIKWLGLITLAHVPNPGMPVKPVELAQGYPGLSQIDMGGAYAYWSGALQVFTQTGQRHLPSPGFCGNACKGQGVADWLWSNVAYQQATAQAGAGAYFYTLGFNDANGSFVHLPYDFHQYMSVLGKVHGADFNFAGDRGIVCSQTPAWAYRHWIIDTAPNIKPGTEWIEPHAYGHDETVAAADALWNSVYSDCRAVSGDFWGLVFASLANVTGVSDFKDAVCSSAAFQVLNCFLVGEDTNGGGCKDIRNIWINQYRASSAAGALSLSPDTLMGLSGRPRTGNTVGPWADAFETAVQWNGGGSTYGCYW